MQLYIASYYFVLWCILILIDSTAPLDLGFWPSFHVVVCGAWVGMSNTLSTCSSGAWEAYAMPSLHAISDHVTHILCLCYMQFRSSHNMCHATITCSCGLSMWYAMLSPNANSELLTHVHCPQLLTCIALYCFAFLCIALSYCGLYCILSCISLMGPKPCGF